MPIFQVILLCPMAKHVTLDKNTRISCAQQCKILDVWHLIKVYKAPKKQEKLSCNQLIKTNPELEQVSNHETWTLDSFI